VENQEESTISQSQRKHGGMEDFLRLLIEFFVGILIGGTVFTTWLAQPFIVPSGSMANTLLGTHYSLTCPKCGYNFDCGVEADQRTYPAACPNCGYTQDVSLDTQPVVLGDKVLAFKQAYTFRDPQRWEVVVFQRPGQASVSYVKRVVGLPGEAVQIRRGDVYIDGKIARKSMDQQRNMAILVHDQNHVADDLPPRWHATSIETRWKSQTTKFSRTAETPQHPGETLLNWTDWLVYQNYQRGYGESPVLDRHAYNLAIARNNQQLRLVTDLMLTCQVQASGTGQLFFRATNGSSQFEIEIDPQAKTALLRHNKQDLQSVTFHKTPFEQPSQIELSLIDSQLIFTINGTPVFEPYPFSANINLFRSPSRPFEIGAKHLGLELSDLKIYRDIYYTDPLTDHEAYARPYYDWAIAQPIQLREDEFFFLGDNSVNSEDSRMWDEGPAVKRKFLIGRPMIVYWPNRVVQWGETRFQVPHFAKIRYIQ